LAHATTPHPALLAAATSTRAPATAREVAASVVATARECGAGRATALPRLRRAQGGGSSANCGRLSWTGYHAALLAM
jgi:hypothetical protein